MPSYALGIDIGGTFTDIVVFDRDSGRQFNRKELTTHDDPSRGVMTGIVKLIEEDGLAPADFGRVVHATTLFTNALIERKGALTGLITTDGFRDTLEIGRERKYDLYDIAIEKPRPIVPRHLRVEVPERLNADGSVRTPLDVEALGRAVDGLVEAGVGSLAILFLHSYANPAHEAAAAAEVARRHPGLFVTASHDVAPEIREYERASTTVVNAYIKPLAQRYLDQMAAEIAARGIPAPLFLMLSNGGLTHREEAKRAPVQLLESGPAAGALAATFYGGMDAGGNVLAFDMGGTTAKLCTIDEGRPSIAYSFEAARQRRFAEGSGMPIRISALELIEIGAGGGSIAHIDAIGLLKVGPQSAGSLPGPASYGLGGTDPTVTDADFLLGYLNPEFFAGGAVAVDLDAARAAMKPLGDRTGLSVTEIAWGIHDVVNENMASAARVHIAERGKDPRKYALLPTGGAGPVHAYYVARKLGLKRVIAPPAAGVASALGLLVAPAKVDRVANVSARMDQMDWPALEAAYGRLEADARTVIAQIGLDPAAAQVQRFADIRYVGQAFELVVELPPGPYSAGSFAALTEAFEAAYREKFTRTPPSVPAEFINIRVAVSSHLRNAEITLAAGEGRAGAKMLKGHRKVYFPESKGFVETAVYDRYAMRPGDKVEGPAVFEERESTLIAGPGSTVEVMASGNLVITLP